MKRSKFTEEQIIAILREQEAGAKTAEVVTVRSNLQLPTSFRLQLCHAGSFEEIGETR